ncbi:hypothetical protein Pelo_18371 [Pelomyxa schiedti]|nr:hypothetical protein Pelo_18371 [Pelomyxa schiedti]
MCNVAGVWLTPGHPVFMDGTWKHPFEITRVRTVFVDELFNFELSGGPMSPDHSVFINGLLVCTLGKDCGKRIVGGWPKADQLAGTGYWRNASRVIEFQEVVRIQWVALPGRRLFLKLKKAKTTKQDHQHLVSVICVPAL